MIIKKYKELEDFFNMFKKGNADLLIVMSRAGLSKTTTFKEIMKGEDYVYINTHSTVLRTYLNLYKKRDMPVCFDDVGNLLNNSTFVSLLKALTDTSPIKELHYNSTTKLLGNVPERFKTTSRACLLLNQFDIRNKTLEPILDRGVYIQFEPSKEEILGKIKEIAKSQNIVENSKCVYEFIEKNYQKIEDLSLRTFIKALYLYADNPKNWEEKFMNMIGFDEKVIEYLKLKKQYTTDKEMIEKYKWSRATFYRIKQEAEE